MPYCSRKRCRVGVMVSISSMPNTPSSPACGFNPHT
ncbi:Uncharacterised protein [Vibrio cholerae]|nr:Uncharacterised protein [Vibrio cholerae]